MKYISTRGGVEPLGFSDSVMMGLARDGGLLLPETIPGVADRLSELRKLSYPDLAIEIMRPYVDLPEDVLTRIVRRSYSVFSHPEITPAVKVGPLWILELFHGPTLAFKDVALQFLGNLFEYTLGRTGQELNILAATSGDTGSAAICGVRGRERIRIFVMHPHNRVSKIQEAQMTSVLDPNVFNIAVDGTFDDCQGIMKTVFNDLPFKDRYSLGTVNSINWARVLAQVVYYFYAAFRVMDATGRKSVSFSVPTGNFGDIFAGYVAYRMGLPVTRLVLATNENDILARFFNTGTYSQGAVHATLSPSMDIQVASNFERYLYYRFNSEPQRVASAMKGFASTGSLSVEKTAGESVDPLFRAGSGNGSDTAATIRKYYSEYGYLLDPHSAVGVCVAEKYIEGEIPMISLSTAHPAKFPQAIIGAIGNDIAKHAAIAALKDLPTRMEVLPSSVDSIRNYIERQIAG